MACLLTMMLAIPTVASADVVPSGPSLDYRDHDREAMPYLSEDILVDDGSLYYDIIADANRNQQAVRTSEYAYTLTAVDEDENDQQPEDSDDMVYYDIAESMYGLDIMERGYDALSPEAQQQIDELIAKRHPIWLPTDKTEDGPLFWRAHDLKAEIDVDYDDVPEAKRSEAPIDVTCQLMDDTGAILAEMSTDNEHLFQPGGGLECQTGIYSGETVPLVDDARTYTLRATITPTGGQSVTEEATFHIENHGAEHEEAFLIRDTPTEPLDENSPMFYAFRHQYPTGAVMRVSISIQNYHDNLQPRYGDILYDPTVRDDEFTESLVAEHPDGITPVDAELAWQMKNCKRDLSESWGEARNPSKQGSETMSGNIIILGCLSVSAVLAALAVSRVRHQRQANQSQS